MPRIQSFLSRGRMTGAGRPTTLNPGVGQIRGGVGIGSITSAVPQLRQRQLQGTYIQGQKPIFSMVDPKSVDNFANAVANTMTAVVLKDNQLKARTAYTNYRDEARELETGYFAKTGQDAVESHLAFQHSFDLLQKKYLDELNPGAREQAMKMFIADRESVLNSAARHVVAQRKVWEQQDKINQINSVYGDLSNYQGDVTGAYNFLNQKAAVLFPGMTAKDIVDKQKFINAGVETAFKLSLRDGEGNPIPGRAGQLGKELMQIRSRLDANTIVNIIDDIYSAHKAETAMANKVESDSIKALQKKAAVDLTDIYEKMARNQPLDPEDLMKVKVYSEGRAIAPSTYKTVATYDYKSQQGPTTSDPLVLNDYWTKAYQGKLTPEDMVNSTRLLSKEDRKAVIKYNVSAIEAQKKTDIKLYDKMLYAQVLGIPLSPYSEDFWQLQMQFGSKEGVTRHQKIVASLMLQDFHTILADPENKKSPKQILDDLYIKYEIKGSPAYEGYLRGQEYKAENFQDQMRSVVHKGLDKIEEMYGSDPRDMPPNVRQDYETARQALIDYFNTYIGPSEAFKWTPLTLQ